MNDPDPKDIAADVLIEFFEACAHHILFARRVQRQPSSVRGGIAYAGPRVL